MNILYITHPLNGLLMIAVAAVIGYFLSRNFKLSWDLWWIGGFTFILSQIAHIPFNLLFLNPLITKTSNSLSSEIFVLLFTAVMLGLSAGVFEECARYAVYRWWQKDARSWSKAVLFGAGHGGIEAIILGFLVLLTFFQIMTLGTSDLSSLIPEEKLVLVKQQVDAYWSVPWHLSLLGAVERTFTIPFHISAAVLVLQTFKRQQKRWLFLAIGWHTVINAIVIVSSRLWGIYIAEGLLGILAIISLAIIYVFREPFEEIEEELPPLETTKSLEMLETIEVSKDRIDSTRYN
jgi:uncharacterized membrane protein YhfC